ncbi:MAG TPA: hypothetical protein VE842_07255 [Pyrinomonadaceae bacterium]|jgi:hypothetical protein|nr:hypothetical protein [Pyrinomonadaceae bacterium]
MSLRKRSRELAACAFILIYSLSASTLATQSRSKENKKKERPAGTPVLWQEPVDIASRDLFLGPGGEAMRPDLQSLTFLEEEKGGYSTKYRVRDRAGREWVVKVGKEAQSETAAVRLLWAVGYYTEINYLAPRANIPGKGSFENVRFEARPDYVKRLDEWKWKDNPFVWTKQLQGLIVMMALLNNWDIKDTNNKILQVRSERTGKTELRYIISDLGATFGKVKLDVPGFWRIARNRNEPGDYRRSGFVEDVKNGQVYFFYKGKSQELFDDIKVEEARWIGDLLARLSDRQIADAFRAANYTAAEVQMLTRAVRERINELVALPK